MSESRKPIFLEIHATISAANAFMRCMYRAGLWLSHEERDFLLKAGTRCVNSFLRCALRAFNASATRWKFMPKFHLFGEWLFSMEKQKRLGLPSPNLLMFSCQMDEDYVGRISSISRTVSLRAVHTRTLTRYLIALVANWGWICYLFGYWDPWGTHVYNCPLWCSMAGPHWSDRSCVSCCIFEAAAGWSKQSYHEPIYIRMFFLHILSLWLVCERAPYTFNCCGRKICHISMHFCDVKCIPMGLGHGGKRLGNSVCYFNPKNNTQWRSWLVL